MQQADAAVSNREAMCMKVSTLHVIQRVTKQRILIGTNIGPVNTKSCNFTKIIQDNTNHSIEIYSHFKRKVFLC